MEFSFRWCALAFAPFDGVLLDDPRDPIPGAVAVQLHFRVERRFAAQDRRHALKATALRDRAAACQALLGQGLLPEQLKSLEGHGLSMGKVRDPLSFASLLRHLEAYLEAVEGSGYLEPSVALWQAADRQLDGGHGFWVERQIEDGPLEAGIQDLAPPRLRALCALPELGAVRFHLATRRGAGRTGLFESLEPHLVRLLLPSLEQIAIERGLEHLELAEPPGWGETPWGEALDRLFAGPLLLDEAGRDALCRRELPTEAAVWRAAVEQTRAWVDAGLDPSAITLVHPEPDRIGPLLGPLLAAEGLPLRSTKGSSLLEAPTWGPLWTLLAGLRDADPAALAAGLGASVQPTGLGRALRALAERLECADQAGEASLDQAFEALREGDRAWLQERWSFARELARKTQTPLRWLQDLEALAQRLELMHAPSFYPAFGLLRECAASDPDLLPFPAFLDLLESALEAMRAPDSASSRNGIRLLGPEALEHSWAGSRATLLLDLGEGIWPPAPAANPELDWPRLTTLNAALRHQSAAGGGAIDFPPKLQAIPLPFSEEGEVLPRAFHRAAYGFNRVLALTTDRLVALSAERDSDGQRRAQGPFWRALDGAGTWTPNPSHAASRLRWRWESSEADAVTCGRQAAVKALPAGVQAGLLRSAPLADHLPGLWVRGDDAERPLSPTLLEGLARCPFRVLADRHFGLASWEAGDQHPLNLGSLAHKLMESALQGLEGEVHWPAAFLARQGLTAPSSAEIHGLLKSLWKLHAEDWLAELKALSIAEDKRLRLSLEELLPSLADLLTADLAQGDPTEEELKALGVTSEGPWRRELLGLEYHLAPRSLALPDGGTCWVQGTVDRLERLCCGESRFLRIVDYKSSAQATLKAYLKDEGALGAHLQLPLYQAMLEAESGLPVSALLVSLKGGWKPLPMMLRGEDRERLLTHIGTLLTRAQRGDFPAAPGEHCATCRLSALCARPVDIDAPADEEEGE